jgi:hypothetical protein
MFDLFKIKKIKMRKEELEQENAGLLEALTRANDANRELVAVYQKNKDELKDAIERIKYLDGQLRMKDLQKQSRERYNDDSRNY